MSTSHGQISQSKTALLTPWPGLPASIPVRSTFPVCLRLRLERWLGGQEHAALTEVPGFYFQYLCQVAPELVTSALGDLTPLFGFCGYMHRHTHIHTHKHTNNKNYKSPYEEGTIIINHILHKRELVAA